MSPLPGEALTDDPFSQVQASNSQMLQEAGLGIATPESTQQYDGMSWPPGLQPTSSGNTDVQTMGLPSHLTQPSSTFVPSPDDAIPSPPIESVPIEDPNLNLAAEEGHRKLKCPKCDHVQSATKDKCENCGHDMIEARKAKFANLSQQDGKADGKPPFVTKTEDKNKGDDAKVKCPSCGAMNPAAAKECKRCGRSLVGIKGGNFDQRPQDGHRAKLYQLALSQDNSAGLVEQDGLVWKIACKTGTLALSPGPNQVAVDEPLNLTGELFRDMVLSLEEKALPYCTVPETHNNGSMENQGYVRKALVLSHDQAMSDPRVSEQARSVIASDPTDTEYLLAGIDFTEPEAKRKALNGSIPDTSIGVKFGWRNTRTGKSYKAVFEHLALTPMPWIDGLPAFGMAADGKFAPPSKLDYEQYDGVYVDAMDLDVSQEKRDRAQKAGHTMSDGSFPIENESDLRKAIQAVGRAKDVDAAKAWIRKRAKELGCTHLLGEGFNASAQEMKLDIRFDPKAHPRDPHGRFREVLADMRAGDTVNLPGGLSVQKFHQPHGADAGDQFELRDNGRLVEDSNDTDGIAGKAVDLSVQADPAASVNDDGTIKSSNVVGIDDDAVKPDEGIPEESDVEGLTVPSVDELSPGQLQSRMAVRRAEFERLKREQQRRIDSNGRLSQDGNTDEDLSLTLSNNSRRMASELSPESHQENQDMSQTVEQVLASQQVDIEQANDRIKDLESQLQLAHGTISAQGEQIHLDSVSKRISELQEAGVSPALCLAAKTIYEADKTGFLPQDGGGLNLSISAPVKDKDGNETVSETVLKSPTDIVNFMLSAAATDQAATASAAAQVQHQVAQLNLSAHVEKDEQQKASDAVEANERRRHPHRFKDGGKGERIRNED